MLKRSYEEEIIDSGRYTKEEIGENFDDIVYFNKTFGIYGAIIRNIGEIIKKYELNKLYILDVGTGSADIPVAIASHFRKKAVKIRILAIDSDPLTVNIAKKYSRNFKEITVKKGDAFDLGKKKFDIVLCSMTLHHIPDEKKIGFLNKLDSVAIKSLVLCDLTRSLHGYLSVLLLSRLVSKGRLTKNDAPLSILRSLTKSELCNLAGKSKLKNFIIKRNKFFKIFLISSH